MKKIRNEECEMLGWPGMQSDDGVVPVIYLLVD